MKMNLRNLFLACYEDAVGGAEGDPAAEAAAAAAAAALAAGGGTGNTDAEKIKDQAHLNSVLKKEKEKFRAADEKRAKQLEEFQASARLTAEQNTALTAQIEELRTSHLSVEEKARREKERLDKEWQTKHSAAEQQAKHWQLTYTDLKIGSEIQVAADTEGVIKQNKKFLEAFLKPSTRLAPDVDDDGKEIGTYTARVKFSDHDKDGKPIIVDLTVPEAVKRMKELPDDFGYLFETHTKGGLGGGSGNPGKKANVGKMSTAEYLKARKENPNLVYGQ